MKHTFAVLGLLVALGAGGAAAQTRVSIALIVADPHIAGHIVIGRPYYRSYSRPHYHRYRPRPVLVVAPRVYRPARVVVVRPHRHHPRRYHRR